MYHRDRGGWSQALRGIEGPELEVVRRMGLEITEVRIALRDDDKLKAFASMTFNDAFVIRGLKIIEGTNGMFVAMPSRKKPDGTFQDIAHPINNESRTAIEARILDEYEKERARQLIESSSAG